MTCDCNNAEIISIKRIFPDCQIILCFFHIIKNCVHKLPELKMKVKTKKLRVKNLFAKIKLLLFVKANNIETMFKKKILEYKTDFLKFIKYFYKNFFMKYPLKERIWNFNKSVLLFFDNPNIIFLLIIYVKVIISI